MKFSRRRRKPLPSYAQIEIVEPRAMLSATITLPATADVAEDANAGGDHAVATFTLSNIDADSVDISTGNSNGEFSISFNQGDTSGSIVLPAGIQLDANAQSTYYLQVVASSYATGEQVTGDIQVNVTAAPDNEQTYSGSVRYDWDLDGTVDDAVSPTVDPMESEWIAVIGEQHPLEIQITSDGPLAGKGLVAQIPQGSLKVFGPDGNEITEENPYMFDGTASSQVTLTLQVEGVLESSDSIEFRITEPDNGIVGFPLGRPIGLLLPRVFIPLPYLNAKWAKSVRTQWKKHQSYDYYKELKWGTFFQNVYDKAKTVAFSVPIGASAEWDYFTDRIKPPLGGTLLNYTAIHELMHAIDDDAGWNLPDILDAHTLDEEGAEALTWSMEHLLASSATFRTWENLINAGTITDANWESNWKKVIKASNDIMTKKIHWDGNTESRNVTPDDLEELQDKFGLGYDFSKLIPMYEAKLQEIGVNVSLPRTVDDVTLDDVFK